MPATLLDGKHVAQLTETDLAERVAALKAKTGDRTPVLATIWSVMIPHLPRT